MSRGWSVGAVGLPVLVLVAAAYLQAHPQQSPALAPMRQAPSTSEDRALLNKYCLSCHNEKSKQGNFVLSTLDVADVGADAERWELVVRKLRARSMPPAGRPRPSEADYNGLIGQL